MWLFLLAEGGRWSTAEVAKALRLDTQRVSVVLGSMAHSESVLRFDKSSRAERVRFGVTLICCIPQGVTLAEALKAAGVGA